MTEPITITTILVVALAVCGILAAIKWYHTRNELKALRKRLKALRERLDTCQKRAQRWIRATDAYMPLIEMEVDPPVVEEMKADLEDDKQILNPNPKDKNDQ